MADVLLLDGVARAYAWGSPTLIPDLLGSPGDGAPLAELWFGAHPDAPAGVPALGRTLDDLVGADPHHVLGDAVAERFGELPFLVKFLAADHALSIQVHPTRDQAQAGFAREESAGVAPSAPHRMYRDRNHKPELICALTDFEALCGFRPVARSIALLERFDVLGLLPVAELLRGPDPLRTAFTYLLELADPAPLVHEVVAAADAVEPAPELPEFGGAVRAVLQAGTDFPGDRGVLVTLLLNYVRLAPGEAMYLGAGNVHAYLRGLGVEVMAASDNVLRAGLSPKHVDVAELLAVSDFSELSDPRVGRRTSWGTVFPVPAEDFAVCRIDLDAAGGLHEIDVHGGPATLACVSGSAEVDAGGARLTLRRGQVAFVPASGGVTLRGHGELVVTTVGA